MQTLNVYMTKYENNSSTDFLHNSSTFDATSIKYRMKEECMQKIHFNHLVISVDHALVQDINSG